ncbi:MAG: zinc-ribbon domain-containing protein [Pseudonocardiales bacterium]
MLIFGTKGYLRALAIVTFVCRNCHNPAAQRVINRVTKFTLFFIPLFPVSSSYLTTCTFCGYTTKIDKAAAESYAAAGAAQAAAPVGPSREQIPGGYGAPGYDPQFGGPFGYGNEGQSYGAPEGQQYGPQHGAPVQPYAAPESYGQSGPTAPAPWTGPGQSQPPTA